METTDTAAETDTLAAHFFARGWVRLPTDPAVAAWVAAAAPAAERIAKDPEQIAQWLRCGGTWFAGVNALPNDPNGAVAEQGVPPLPGSLVAFIAQHLGLSGFAWDQAQVSVCYPGYPQPWEGETEAAFRFRRDRDAAHVDGLLRKMPGRRRQLGEVHGFVLGLPLASVSREAAPLVVWEGSHEIMRTAFAERFGGLSPDAWPAEDITDCYVAARRLAFETCERVPVHANPGEAYLVHRLALHGVAPWSADHESNPRPIAYFRPDPFPGAALNWWLERP